MNCTASNALFPQMVLQLQQVTEQEHFMPHCRCLQLKIIRISCLTQSGMKNTNISKVYLLSVTTDKKATH